MGRIGCVSKSQFAVVVASHMPFKFGCPFIVAGRAGVAGAACVEARGACAVIGIAVKQKAAPTTAALAIKTVKYPNVFFMRSPLRVSYNSVQV